MGVFILVWDRFYDYNADEHNTSEFIVLRARMRRLPPVHQTSLRIILEHLAKIASQSEKNKMDPKNLAIIFSGVIFGEDEMPKNGDLLTIHSSKVSLVFPTIDIDRRFV